MQETKSEILDQIHEAYRVCKKVFEPSVELIDESFKLENQEEIEFFSVVSSFFMQKKQERIING